MINRDTHKELCDKYESVKTDAKYWETQAKTLEIRKAELQIELQKAKAELKLWMGTGV